MRLVALLLVCAGSLLAQTGTVIPTFVRPLDCGARYLTPSQVQTWCFVHVAGQPAVLVHNTISTFNLGPTIASRVDDAYEYSDSAGGDTHTVRVAWSMEQTGIADAIKLLVSATRCTQSTGCGVPVVQSGLLQQ